MCLGLSISGGQSSEVPLRSKTPKPIQTRRAERELFFWTARQILLLVLLVAVTIGSSWAWSRATLQEAMC